MQGQNFKGQNLSGADFSHSDIRGANFTNCCLNKTKFVKVKSGLTKISTAIVLLALASLAVFSGYLLRLAGDIVTRLISFDISALVALVFLISFEIVAFRRGLSIACEIIAFTIAIVTFILFVSLLVIGLPFIIDENITEIKDITIRFLAIVGFGLKLGGEGILLGTYAVTLAAVGNIAGAIAGAGTRAITQARSITFLFIFAILAGGFVSNPLASHHIFSFVFALLTSYLSLYIGQRILKNNSQDPWIRTIAIAFAATRGTNFYNANLIDSDFTKAALQNTNFIQARLRNVCWKDTIKLDYIRPGNTYLNDSRIRELARTKNGQGLKYDGLHLQGLNLQGANLQSASFIEANLNKVNLKDAHLTDARLVYSQMNGADLTGADLTGAYIEGWNIDTTTKLNAIRCKYVFMRLPPSQRPPYLALSVEENLDPNPRRKPDDWNQFFEDGDFGDFIRPLQETLDLYHNQFIDPRLVALAFNKLDENNPQAQLELVAIEKRGESKDKLLLRVETRPQADHPVLAAEYFTNLNSLQSLTQETLQALLDERGRIIKILVDVIENKDKNPDVVISTNFNSTQTQGGPVMSNDSKNFSISGDSNRVAQGDNSLSVLGDNTQAVQGDNNQLSQGAVEAVKEPITKEDALSLMAELETLIQNSDLPKETKEEVLTYLKTTRTATDKSEPKKDLARVNLEEMTKVIQNATGTVVASKTLWTTAKPIILKIASWLGAVATGSFLAGL
nr:pentapeptide repeat-containing protein [Laspinema sp. D3c]